MPHDSEKPSSTDFPEISENEAEILIAIVPDSAAGKRLDQALGQLFEQYSRSRLQQWIKAGRVTVEGEQRKAKEKVYIGESIVMKVEADVEVVWTAEEMPLDIVYEDDDILVVNKPVGLVVHPAPGHASGTLCNGLLHHVANAVNLPRAGVVHRLDKDTSGIMVVAKTLSAHCSLVESLQAREISREYIALVLGEVTAGGTVDEPMGRHKVDRKRMAVLGDLDSAGKHAVTHYRIRKRYHAYTLLDVKLETGRTHQIRVHMAYINFPIVGDPVYGGRMRTPKNCSENLRNAIQNFKRQALHAFQLTLTHPVTKQEMSWQVPLADDIEQLLSNLEEK